MLSGNSHGIYRGYCHTWSSDLLIKKIYNHSGFDFHLNDRATALINFDVCFKEGFEKYI